MKQTIPMPTSQSIDSIVSYCCGNPQGDELPQVAGEADIAVDVFNDLTAFPREYAAAYLHQQINDEDMFH